jgi:putative phage-type endonuclease
MVTMKRLKSREEWLKMRQSYIGGSDASCIVGMNPYKTNVDLWELKTGRRKAENLDGNPFVEYGKNAEEFLRELFKLDFPEYQVEYVDNNIWLNDSFKFAHASLDGWLVDELGRLGVLEIKTTNILQSMQKEKWNHRIPDNYYIQVLHYMAVLEADFAVLKAQLKYEFDGEVYLTTKHYKIERSEVEEDIDYLMNAEKNFSEYIKADERPSLVLPAI